MNECSAYLASESRCRNGFMQSSPCRGLSLESMVPQCCDEDSCARHFRETGKPEMKGWRVIDGKWVRELVEVTHD